MFPPIMLDCVHVLLHRLQLWEIIGQMIRTPLLKNPASNVDLGKKIANNNQLFRQSDEIIWTQNESYQNVLAKAALWPTSSQLMTFNF